MLQDTISAAARQLDNIRPGWASQITNKVNMEDGTRCILGQLFGKYRTGIWELFGIDIDNGLYYNSVFAHKADSAEWQKEVDLRNKQESTGWEPVTGGWAMKNSQLPKVKQIELKLNHGTILVDTSEIRGIIEMLQQLAINPQYS